MEATPLENSNTRYQMTGMKQPVHISLPTPEIEGAVNTQWVSLTHSGTTQKIVWTPLFNQLLPSSGKWLEQDTVIGTTPPLRILNSGIDVPRSGRNIDNCTGMNPQGPIVTKIPEYNRANNCNIFKLIIKPLDLAYMVLPWHDTMKSESENLKGNKCFENAERKNNSEVEKVGPENYVFGITNFPTKYTLNRIIPTQINPLQKI